MRSKIFLWLALCVGATVRLFLALHDDGIYWPDEIYQGLEPAHRLVYGYGLLPWEYIEGARTWLLPVLVAMPMKLTSLLGFDSPHVYILAIRLVFVAISTSLIYGVYLLSAGLGADRLSASILAFVFGIFIPEIYFSPKALGETLSAFLVLFGFVLALPRTDRTARRVSGAFLIGAASLIRLQNALFCIPLIGIWIYRRDKKAIAQVSLPILVCVFGMGLLDRLTWGHWFQSAALYLKYNLLVNKAAHFGTESALYYFTTLVGSSGIIAVVILLLSAPAFRKSAIVPFAAYFYVLAHSSTPHKELRFLLPALPLIFVSSALGLAFIKERFPKINPDFLNAATVAIAIFSFAQIPLLTFGDLGQGKLWNSKASAFDRFGNINRLLMAAHTMHDICGLKIEGVPITLTGGYSYFHRNVPLYGKKGPLRDSEYFNYVITSERAKAPSMLIRSDSDYSLQRLAIRKCKSDPSFRYETN